MTNESFLSQVRRTSPAAILAELSQLLAGREWARPVSPQLRATLLEALREGTYPSPILLLRSRLAYASAQ